MINSYEFYNRVPKTEQSIYDSYNKLIFSADTRVINKMVKRVELYQQVKELPGDIVEVGVFKGAGLGLFLNLKGMYEPHSLTKVIGFDYFNRNEVLGSLDGMNKEMMTHVLNRGGDDEISLEGINKNLSNFNPDDYILVKGDAVVNCEQFYRINPGARIKLLYMDIDVGEPTYNILKSLWNRVVEGGIIIFDEYGYHKWDESDGVDKFLKEIKGEYIFIDTKIYSPTAYIKKQYVQTSQK
jgi:hypothetical protein